MLKAVFFDWGRTLWDSGKNRLFQESLEVLDYLHKKYRLALVSLSPHPEERLKTIEESGVAKYFEEIFVGKEDKEGMYESALEKLGLTAKEVAVVDDRTVRGVAWGNKRGVTTIWFKKGKFSTEVPNEETGEPSFVVTDLMELKRLL